MMRYFFVIILSTLLINAVVAQHQASQPFNLVQIGEAIVFGKSVDKQTRCVHWHSPLDVIAIKFKCCDRYYPCFSCHEEEADHEHQVWPAAEFDEKAVLCGVCGHEMTILSYKASNNTCPKCNANFNPGCSNHYHLYFEVVEKDENK